jgi:DNA-binding beta-propeller fold protein YncE
MVGCGPSRKLIDPEGLVVSPDGANLYGTAFASGALDVFDRQPSTGALMQKPGRLGCFVSRAKRGCSLGRGGLHGVSSAAISPDGNYLYAVANASNSVTVFRIARYIGSEGCLCKLKNCRRRVQNANQGLSGSNCSSPHPGDLAEVRRYGR